MEKILITGSSGMLGSYIARSIDRTKYEVFCPSSAELNLKDPEAISKAIKEIAPNVILHLAAETNVDLCEVDVRHAAKINCKATEVLSKAASEVGAWVVYISTSNVFGARKKLTYNELDLPDPENYYGRSKLAGEKAIEKYCSQNCLIIRVSWMIGGGFAKDQKFVGKIVGQIKAGASVLRAVDDKYGTVTLASSLAAFIIRSIPERKVGTYHFASQGLVTRFDIAKAVVKYLNFEGEVLAVKSSQFPLSAPRPDSEGIVSVYLDKEDGIGLFEDDIKKYISEEFV